MPVDPTVQAALWGGAALVVVKAIDVALGRTERARAVRDELRADRDRQIERRHEEEARSEHERKRRLEAEAEIERLEAELKHKLSELEDAEAAARLARDFTEQMRRWLSERELERERYRHDVAALQSERAELRRRLRALGDDPNGLVRR